MNDIPELDELGTRAAAAVRERAEHRSAVASAPAREVRRRPARAVLAGSTAALAAAVAIGVAVSGGTAPEVTVGPGPDLDPPTTTAPQPSPGHDAAPPGGDDPPAAPLPCDERAASEDHPHGWQVEVDGAVLSAPTLAGELVLIGSFAETTDDPEAGCLLALTTDDGTVAWDAPGSLQAGTLPRVVDDLVIVTFTDALVAFALDDGHEAWRTEAVAVNGDTVVTEDLVVTISEDGAGDRVLRTLDVRTGEPRWEHTGEVWSPLHVDGGAVSVRTRDEGMRLLDLDDGSVLRDLTVAGGRHVVDRRGDRLFTLRVPATQGVLDASDGSLIWESNVPGAANSGLLVVDDRLIVAGDVGEVYGIGLDSGVYEWRTDLGATPLHTPSQLGPTPTVANGAAHLATADGVVAVDTTSGEIRWRAEVGDVTTPLQLLDGVLYAIADGDLVTINPADGAELGRRTLGEGRRPDLATDGEVAAVRTARDRLVTIATP